MTEPRMQLEDWLDDLCVRFIINLPREELESVERICFQVEEAQWFYEDFIRPLDPALPSLSLKAFALRIFQHCPLMANWSRYHHMTAFSEFLAYKTRVPVVLVKGWKKGANWSFPRGKINKDEKDLDCAIREVYEETGYDVREAGLVKDEEDHMRLYVFRGVPQDAYFEPRTRKEISKIEWWKLSDLPTLKKSKQYDEGQAAANANKFYMVAPFLHPLKKWIAQQKKLDPKAHLDIKQTLNDGDISMDEGLQTTNIGLMPNQVPRELAVPSDLPEVAAPHDASAHLKRLLNINNGFAVQEPANVPNTDPNSSKSNALLELLRSGASPNPTPQAPRNEPQPSGFFPGFPQHYGGPPGPPGPQGNILQVQYRGPSHSPFPSGNQHVPQPPTGYPGAHHPGPSNVYPVPPSLPQPPPGQSRPFPPAFPPLHGQGPAPAPYQQTGDPQFSHSAQPPQIQAAVPPASKLPPPKLTSHSLALLSVFKDDKKQTPQMAPTSLAPRPGPSPRSERRPSAHQGQLLSLLKGSPLPTGARPAELSAYPSSPAQKHILQRPSVNSNPPQPQQATKGAWTSATVSGPLNTPQFEAIQKSSSKKTHDSKSQVSRDWRTQPLASPITILPRPQSARREQIPTPAPVPPTQPSIKPQAAKSKSPEPRKTFQPQILRRSDKADIHDILPVRTKEAELPNQPNDIPGPDLNAASSPQPDPFRRPSQTTAQRETLLSLFGKPATSPRVSPAGQLNLQTAVPKPSVTPSVISPLTPLHHHAGNELSMDDAVTMMRPKASPSRICARCSQQWRKFSTTPQPRTRNIPQPPPQAGYARLTNRGLISITGLDSTTFLQGLLTQNMFIANDPNRRVRHTGSYTAFLNSTGRILNDAFIYPLPPSEGASPDEPAWLVEVDKNEVPSLLKHLKKHKLRAKLKLQALEEDERTVWAAWKNYSEPRWAAYNLESPTSSPFPSSESVVGCVDTRAPGFGFRLVTPGVDDLRTHVPDEAQVAGSEVSLDGYTIRRMLHGVAEGQSEIIRESSLPLECNMDMQKAIDFRKGCYVGQELTIRTHHTGVVRKRILPVQLYEGDGSALASTDGPVYDPSVELSLPPSGSNISKVSARRGRSAGKFLGGIGNIGLALCRLEMMTDITLTGEGSQFTPDQEFKVSWSGPEGSEGQGGEVKLKAIVPTWTREFIMAGGAKNNNDPSRDGHRARNYLEQLEEEEAQR
ncbi:hypothetical protein BJY01DRAFT_237360 [Aspergillus pseudoustus]|uniref:Iron-sulfur cluster assembly factor IBA57 homolog, mitochondrial n=1 Tax=Aspergillus pseudoustus TaxID=1810923 RepID=A0ABR4JF83_9EURO